MSVRFGGNILVTGSNRGIGLELVKQLVAATGEHGHIFACCREPDGPSATELQRLAEDNPGQITVIKLDISNEASIRDAVRAVGERVSDQGLNLLINNAAINIPAAPASLSLTGRAEMMEVFQTNVVGPFLLAKEFLPHLQRAAESQSSTTIGGAGGMSCRKSSIINLSTSLSSIARCPETFHEVQMYAYRTSKAALNMLTRCLAEDFRKHNILVTAIHPGWVQTDMGGKEAPLTTQDSIQGMLSVMSSLSDKDSGTLLDWQGNSIPW